MIFTKLEHGQGLGNQLWAIFALQSAAKELNTDFYVSGREHLKCSGFDRLKLSSATPGAVPINNFTESMMFHPVTGENITTFDELWLSSIRDGDNLSGYFQSERYLPARSHIQEQLALDGTYFDGCTISLRGGEYRGIPEVFLPKTYFDNAMGEIRKRFGEKTPFRVVTDDPGLAKEWFPTLPIISSGGVKRFHFLPYFHPKSERVAIDFSSIQNSRFQIVSNSSFSWWAAYSSLSSEFTIAPKYWAAFNTSNGYWSQGDSLSSNAHWLDSQGILSSFTNCELELKSFRMQHNWAG